MVKSYHCEDQNLRKKDKNNRENSVEILDVAFADTFSYKKKMIVNLFYKQIAVLAVLYDHSLVDLANFAVLTAFHLRRHLLILSLDLPRLSKNKTLH